MFRILAFVFSSIIVFIVTLYFRLGGHKPVEIDFVSYPEMHLVYKKHQGPYHKINDIIVEVESWAQKNNYPCAKTFGEYLDDPTIVQERHLQSRGGCVLPSKPMHIENNAVEYMYVSEKKWVKAEFTGAPSISPLKVYPKVEDYLLRNNLSKSGSVFEIYNITGQNQARTEYLFHVSISK